MNKFKSIRQAVYAKNGVVATSQPLAAQVGLDILKKGGNAIDAAVATAACLTVVEPCSNGIGSDAFAIVYFKDKIYGLNASGPSSRNISIEKLKNLNITKMPKYGLIPITVPGAPKAWSSLISKFGNLTLEAVLAPAIEIARNGFIVNDYLGERLKNSIKNYENYNKGPEYETFFKIFKNGQNYYKTGDLFKSELIAETLEEIAKTNSDSFYQGALADKIVNFMNKNGGYIDKEDLRSFEPEYVTPISINYHGYDILELPPNGQGITTLMALNIMKTLNNQDKLTLKHQQIEALKIAFSDTLNYVSDPKFMKMNPNYLISSDYAKNRSQQITDIAQNYNPIDYKNGGTVYLATADKDGNMVSFIQSNYMGFGSGVVIDGTGISMQNRGHTFSLDKNHENALMPNKRTYHTIIPGFIMKGNLPIGPFGVMGGFMQPQGHLQVLMNLIDLEMDPQAALDAPRFRWDKGLEVAFENSFPKDLIKDLKDRGHKTFVDKNPSSFGHGQIILKNHNYYLCGTETRCPGHIAFY
ncbi:MAG: gamma-glutamyltransferase family protein [Candidatus Izemoplasmatales bacterium]